MNSTKVQGRLLAWVALLVALAASASYACPRQRTGGAPPESTPA
jgi:hypothetical protein